MEINQIRYFLAVVDTGTFTGAARECNISQPSLSAQVAKLENELGGELVERSRHGCLPSNRGLLFLPRAREIMRQIGTAHREISDYDRARIGSIRLGCLPTTGAYVLPPLLKEYRSLYPDVQIRLSEGSSPLLAESLLNHEIELAVMDQAGLESGLTGHKLFDEPLYAALPTDHPLAKGDFLDISSLEGEPLILMQRGHGFNRIVTDVLETAGVRPEVVYESSEIETVQALVRAGLGMSIVPRMICVHRDIKYLRLGSSVSEVQEKFDSEEGPSRSLFIVHREGAALSPASVQLISTAQEMLGKLFSQKAGE